MAGDTLLFSIESATALHHASSARFEAASEQATADSDFEMAEAARESALAEKTRVVLKKRGIRIISRVMAQFM